VGVAAEVRYADDDLGPAMQETRARFAADAAEARLELATFSLQHIVETLARFERRADLGEPLAHRFSDEEIRGWAEIWMGNVLRAAPEDDPAHLTDLAIATVRRELAASEEPETVWSVAALERLVAVGRREGLL